jgi:hypothetical protein
MFEDYYFDDPALQDALAAAGYYAPDIQPESVAKKTARFRVKKGK